MIFILFSGAALYRRPRMMVSLLYVIHILSRQKSIFTCTIILHSKCQPKINCFFRLEDYCKISTRFIFYIETIKLLTHSHKYGTILEQLIEFKNEHRLKVKRYIAIFCWAIVHIHFQSCLVTYDSWINNLQFWNQVTLCIDVIVECYFWYYHVQILFIIFL